ncbi:MAG: hypothetical protein ACXWMT_11020 [Candidatus Binataceae bacterium]
MTFASGIGFGAGLVSREDDGHGICAQAAIAAQATTIVIAWVSARILRIDKG